jgi:hypothetical protein
MLFNNRVLITSSLDNSLFSLDFINTLRGTDKKHQNIFYESLIYERDRIKSNRKEPSRSDLIKEIQSDLFLPTSGCNTEEKICFGSLYFSWFLVTFLKKM